VEAVTAMSYSHADKIAKSGARAVPATAGKPQIDPRLYDRPEVCRILAERDIGALYRALNDAGVTQRQIAELTGQSQSEVSETLSGCRVLVYDVLVRIAEIRLRHAFRSPPKPSSRTPNRSISEQADSHQPHRQGAGGLY